MSEKLLEIKDLHVHYVSDGETVRAVNGISFYIERGETLGLVGETGAGKSTTALAILNMLPQYVSRVPQGEILVDGDNVLTMKPRELQRLRGSKVSMVFQENRLLPWMSAADNVAAVLVLSTSDRSVKSDTGFAPMSSAPAMVDWQRRAARATGAAFWSVYDAMRAQGGMERFVANGWAGKDYTHINYAGGRQVAYALVDALDARVAAILRQRQQAALPEPVLDSSKIAALDETMNLRPQPIEPR